MSSVKSYECMFKDLIGVSTDVPELWIQHDNALGRDCFKGVTNAPNFNIIPVGWGGGIYPVSCNLNFGIKVQTIIKLEKLVCDTTK